MNEPRNAPEPCPEAVTRSAMHCIDCAKKGHSQGTRVNEQPSCKTSSARKAKGVAGWEEEEK